MARISETEFERLVTGILDDRKVILQHNPIGTEPETLLWMLMCSLISYLSIDDSETPCFTGRPDADTYLEAIRFILRNRRAPDFDAEPYLVKISGQ